MEVKQIIENTKLDINKSQIKYNEPMKAHTSFKIGGPAEVYIVVKTIQELQKINDIAKKNNIPIYIIGNGSNILVTDKGIKGIVIKNEIKKLEIENEKNEENIKLKVGAGNKIIETAHVLLKEEISGFEELSGIPGTIGGAIKMNAGANGKEIKDIITQVVVLDEKGNIEVLQKDDLNLTYRNSIFKTNKSIILEAEFILKKGKKEEIKYKMDNYAKIRKEKQPLEYPSAGSTFKRGDNYITAKLIDEAGLKGFKIGGAEISTKHAGFIINKNNATAKDILDLIKYTQDEIYKKFGKKIQLEVEIIGEID